MSILVYDDSCMSILIYDDSCMLIAAMRKY